MVQEGVKVFCFHSVRNIPTIPPSSSWGDPEVYRMFKDHLIVGTHWFADFLLKASNHWGVENVVITFDDAFADVIGPALYAKRAGFRTIVFVPTAHLGGLIEGVPLRVMSIEDLSALDSMSVEIGSHGHRHLDWAHLPDHAIRFEIQSSSAMLNICCQHEQKTKLLAPPHGSFSLQCVSDALQLGFTEIYGTLDDKGSASVIKRCLADMRGYVENKEDGLVPWPWRRDEH